MNEHLGTVSYWKRKYENALDVISLLSDSSINLENVPGLLEVSKIKPKQGKENVQATQVLGFMEGKKILERVSEIKKEKEEKERSSKGERKAGDTK